MKVSNFRRRDRDSNCLGLFDCEIAPGIKLLDVKLMLNSVGVFHVFPKKAVLSPAMAGAVLAAVMQLSPDERVQQ